MSNNFWKQADEAHRVMDDHCNRVVEQHKDCPNFVVIHDEYSCGEDCRGRNELIADAAKAEEVFDINELEEFAAKFNAKHSNT